MANTLNISFVLGLTAYLAINSQAYSYSDSTKCSESLNRDVSVSIEDTARLSRAEKRILYFGQEQFEQMLKSVELLRSTPGIKMETVHPLYLELLKDYLRHFEAAGKNVDQFKDELAAGSQSLNYHQFIRYILRIAHKEKNEAIIFRGGISLTGTYSRELRLRPEVVATDSALEQAIIDSKVELLYGDEDTFPQFINFPILVEGNSFGLALFNRALASFGINPSVLSTNNLVVHGYDLRPAEVFLHDLAHGAIYLVQRGKLIDQKKYLSTNSIYDKDKFFLKQIENIDDPKVRVWLNLAFFLFQKEVVSYWDLTSEEKQSFDSFYAKMKDLAATIAKSNETIVGPKAKADFVNKYLWDIKARQKDEFDGHRGVFATFFKDITKHGFLKNVVQDPTDRGEVSRDLFIQIYDLADGINGNGPLVNLFKNPN